MKQEKEISYLDMKPGQLVCFKSLAINYTICFKTLQEIDNYHYLHSIDVLEYNNNFEFYIATYPYDAITVSKNQVIMITEITTGNNADIIYGILMKDKHYWLPFNSQINIHNRTWHLLNKEDNQ
jgi:hypothetical protein